ncbi:hypothetical protein BALOs_1193 [Halobacteriovorax sp. BALOs_7]|nr:hypothetical protein BALOs_1193 [Halobacteriovorax sp. BALOs_7]
MLKFSKISFMEKKFIKQVLATFFIFLFSALMSRAFSGELVKLIQ